MSNVRPDSGCERGVGSSGTGGSTFSHVVSSHDSHALGNIVTLPPGAFGCGIFFKKGKIESFLNRMTEERQVEPLSRLYEAGRSVSWVKAQLFMHCCRRYNIRKLKTEHQNRLH